MNLRIDTRWRAFLLGSLPTVAAEAYKLQSGAYAAYNVGQFVGLFIFVIATASLSGLAAVVALGSEQRPINITEPKPPTP